MASLSRLGTAMFGAGLAPRLSRHLSTAAATAEKRTRVVIVGGVAGGATAAARAMRLDSSLDVTVVERSPDVSFANCGLPYYIGREITDRNRLSLHTPESLSHALGVKVMTNTEVTAVDRKNKSVTIRSVKSPGGGTETLQYDKLILSPGAQPIKPALEGMNDSRIYTLRNLQDMDVLDKVVHNPQCKRVAVIGAGFIGLEITEQLHRIGGKTVTLIERSPAVLPQLDNEFGSMLHTPLIEAGVNLITDDGLVGFSRASDGSLAVKLASGTVVEADAVVLSIGVKPESWLAKNAGLNVTPREYIPVNEFMQTNDPDIYAVGDACETADLVFPERRMTAALGNAANMQARIAIDHAILGSRTPYRGSLGTSIVRVMDTVAAVTGWSEKNLIRENIPYATTTITSDSHASYYPGSLPITMKIMFDKKTGRIFGGQAVGIDGVDKRIDVIATGITGGLTVEDLSLTQLTYSPPFGSARDVANIAGLAARNILAGLIKPAYSLETKGTIVDVRPADVASLHPIPKSVNVNYFEMTPEVLAKLKAEHPGPYLTVCAVGKTSYFAARKMASIDPSMEVHCLVGGLRVHGPRAVPQPPAAAAPNLGAVAAGREVQMDVQKIIDLDCTGLACPGPLMKLKTAVKDLKPGTTIRVKATDPGFKADLAAFTRSNGLNCMNITSSKGVIVGEVCVVGDTPAAAAAGSMPIPTGPAHSGVSDSRKGASIVVFSQDLDKLIGAFIIANGAAAMGGEATMFFTFWGLNAIRKPDGRSLQRKSLVDWAFGALMPKGPSKLQLGYLNFLGLGPHLLRHEMAQKQLPNLLGLIESAKEQNVRMVACAMSMQAMGITKEELMDGVELGGVADFLACSEKTGTNLFI